MFPLSSPPKSFPHIKFDFFCICLHFLPFLFFIVLFLNFSKCLPFLNLIFLLFQSQSEVTQFLQHSLFSLPFRFSHYYLPLKFYSVWFKNIVFLSIRSLIFVIACPFLLLKILYHIIVFFVNENDSGFFLLSRQFFLKIFFFSRYLLIFNLIINIVTLLLTS